VTITIALPFINLTGGIRVLLDYANWLHDHGHRVTVVYPQWPYQFQYTRKQQWVEFRKHSQHDGTVPWLPLRCRLQRVPLIRSMFLPAADVVVAAGWPVAHDVARLSRSRGTKVLIVFHHEEGTGPDQRIESIYQLPYYRIAFSEFVRQSITMRFECTIHEVVPNGVDRSLFFPDGEAEPRSILFLYHPDPRKGAADGIAALCKLREREPDVTIRVGGTVRPERLPGWMPFEFHPGDAILRRRYSQSTVLLYPSRYEGFGLPPLEAMSCGCPSVTTGVGAVPEYAIDGVNAAIVRVGDVDGMVNGAAAILRDGALRQRLSQASLATAERYAIEKVAPMFADALSRANAKVQT
jgi:glycosyltransferase involved in cell wall biosynthesis